MINIGTNFLYKGPLFLDERHGLAQNFADLREWSIPIPDGFEVYLNIESDPAWYTYDSNNEIDDNTGKFRRRIDRAWVENKITNVNASIYTINSEINNLWEAINSIDIQPNLTLEITSPNAGYNLPSPPKVPIINWVLKNYGVPVNYEDISEFVVNNTSYTPISPWNNSGQTIDSDTTYTLSVTYSQKTVEGQVSYIFRDYDWIKYFGTSDQPVLSNISELQYITSSGWGNTTAAFTGTADCTGGKYPYYVIPTSIYNSSTFKMYVGGFRTTDFRDAPLVINGNNYTTIRTGYIQTGILQIRYE